MSIRDICETVGIPKGSFYYWFKTKEELGLAVLDHHWEESSKRIYGSAFSNDLPPLERLDRYAESVKTMQEGWDRAYGCPFGSVGTEATGLHPGLQDAAAEMLARMGELFKGAIDDAIAAGEIPEQDSSAAAADAVLALTEGMLLVAEIRNDITVFDGLGPGIRALIGAPARQMDSGANHDRIRAGLAPESFTT